jgi:transaldolase
MAADYFHRLNRQTPTRMWINNPTLAEAQKAVAAGGISCTTNPAYCARIMREEPGYANATIGRIVKEVRDDQRAPHLIQQEMAKRVMSVFLPLYRAPGVRGVVSVQGNPHKDTDADHIIAESVDDHARLPPNHIAKIPTTQAGLVAMDKLLRQGIPVIATELFSLAQAMAAAEVYGRVVSEMKEPPACYLTHITGIYDEYLGKWVQEHQVQIAPEVLAEAGCAVARRQYRLLKQRGYPGFMLGGGARATKHFTEMVPSEMHVTINWSTAEEILAADPPLTPRMDVKTPREVVEELRAKLPDFRRAWDLDGLAPEEFAEFGPVRYFLGMFIRGWDQLGAAIRQVRM